MILHWEQLPLHYGPEVATHRGRFETAGQTTYGILCCRFGPDDVRLASQDGEHAEARLLQHEIWTTHIPQALDRWEPRDNPIVVTMAINRSPCRNCSALLVTALGALSRRFPARCDMNRFILASRGIYEDARMQQATTRNDLVRLRDAGWELCVLQVGATLPPVGRHLLEGIQGVVGRGFVRLG
jgi:hypothetical protein